MHQSLLRFGAVLATAVLCSLPMSGCGGDADDGEVVWRDLGGEAEDTGAPLDVRDEADVTGAEDVPTGDLGPCTDLLLPPPGGVSCDDPPEITPHVVDGVFTGSDAECRRALHEWTCKSAVAGPDAYAYFDHVEGRLFIMNDWYLNDDGPIDESCACRFRLFTDNGAISWLIYIYGDQSVRVLRNGVVVAPEDLDAHEFGGATGFGRSPIVWNRDHSMCEIGVAAGLGTFGCALMAPRTGNPCVPCVPTPEQTCRGACGPGAEEFYFTGEVTEEGVEDVGADAGPALLAIVPPRGPNGAVVTLLGYGFGDGTGLVVFNGFEANVLSWSEYEIRAQVPAAARSGPVRVGAHSRWSNALPFEVVCEPACEGRNCGSDGCGGFCGDCDFGDYCDTDGRCVCPPDCYPWRCGDDGCGGTCGPCPADEVCDAEGLCRPPCERECSGRVCGDDGCGGVCGDCPAGWFCEAGGCVQVCNGSCVGRECGDDGCGRSCGQCVGERSNCVGGQCECAASCAGRTCGSDGCGGSCGTCGPGLTCSSGACLCFPSCSGRGCGDDGCGGTCGTCAGGAIQCVDGRCTCVPDCAGRICGDDGCGGSCGGCPTGDRCEDGACVPCVPDCDGSACGPDGCGGSCGTCPGAQDVCQAGECVCLPDCDANECGDNGCGGTCGECPAGMVCDKNDQCVPEP